MRVLMLPGLYNSGPEHWQSIWEKENPGFKRVLQREWESPVRDALLVAPSDPEAESYPKGPTGFSPMPLTRLPFRTIVVASTNDEFVTPERGEYFAERWGARIELIGPAGHINSASGLGGWPAGFALLRELLQT